ncbi:MAG: GNAT family N-acetyltransferase, partial [Oxalobacteraceae bacterium]|nr:GNAT family N-acetyltransferase [Oxalobacteraceae bacterium]
IALNRARMHVKGKRFGMSAAEEYQVCQLMLERGQLSIIEIHGKLCAGLLCTRVGGDMFMHVIAHDPAYDDLRLGLLCCALTIEDAIRRRCQRFHFLWGRYDYKTRLGGERQALSRMLIFRSTWSLMQQPGLVLSHLMTATRAWLRRYRGRLMTKTK